MQRLFSLPESPRARRRLGRVSALVAVALVIGAVVAVIPSRKSSPGVARGTEGPAQLAKPTSTRVPTAERRAIDASLDRFVPAAVERRSADVAWRLAGPELKASSSLAEWRRGSSPVPAYQARERTFHTWTTIESDPGLVVFNLLLHPASRAQGSHVFSGEVIRVHGRWLVNRFYTIAVMNPTRSKSHEIGPADFAAPPAVSQTPSSGKARLGHAGLLPVVGILALVLLLPLSFGAFALVRALRWRRSTRRGARTELPPLPAGYERPEAEEEHDKMLIRH